MHILAPRPPNPELPIFFNVDGVVGESPSRNLVEDVLFVQFVFRFVADHPVHVTTPGLLQILNAVQPSGQIDDETIAAIRATQEAFRSRTPGVIVDGRVSPAHGYIYGGAAWTIVDYNNILQEQCKDVWPRLDKLQGCPSLLAAAVVRTVVGD